jgi:putative ABC transport system substrate-binding protein
MAWRFPSATIARCVLMPRAASISLLVSTLLLGGGSISLSPVSAQTLNSLNQVSRSMPALQVLAPDDVLVVFPRMDRPYSEMFEQIIAGIERRIGGSARKLVLERGAWRSGVRLDLGRHNNAKVVIPLGRESIEMVATSNPEIPVIAGAILHPSPSTARFHTTVTLNTDPQVLFAKLKSIVPAMRRVIVVHDPSKSEGLIRAANEAARQHGLNLTVIEAKDRTSAAWMYEAVFASIDGSKDAVWLPTDPTTVDDQVILPLILEQAWKKSFPVVSSTPSHVERGVLMALYPDYRETGKALGSIAINAASGAARSGAVFSREVQAAVNERTARHLGLNLSNDLLRQFNAVFPALAPVSR